MWWKWFILHPEVIRSAAMVRVNKSIQNNPSTLYTYIFIHKGLNGIKQTSQYRKKRFHKFTGTNYAPQPCCRKTFVLKISCDPYPDALWVMANHHIVWFHKVNFQGIFVSAALLRVARSRTMFLHHTPCARCRNIFRWKQLFMSS